MIPTESIKQLFGELENHLSEFWSDNTLSTRHLQFFRGISTNLWINPYPANCQRHMLLFQTFNIIPKYCFNCYKIQIEPRTVVELFKVMIIFDGLMLRYDNTRKCMVEVRPQVPGTYKSLIYCQSLDDAKEVFEITRAVISDEISEKVPVYIKRGCTEYSIAYPEYSIFDNQGKPVFNYKDEWSVYEEEFDRKNMAAHLNTENGDTFNREGFGLYDAKVMLNWLKYAATIGDKSYNEITNKLVPVVKNLERPFISL